MSNTTGQQQSTTPDRPNPLQRRHPRLRRRLETAARDPQRNDPPLHRALPPSARLIGRVFELSGSLLAHVRATGTEHIPAAGPLLVAGNHVSDMDPFLLGRVLMKHGRYPHFLAKEEVFRVPVVGEVMARGEQLEVRRGTPAAGNVLEEAAVLLSRGEAVALYPEGKETLAPDYWPLQGQPGAAVLALASEAPVVPVAIWGSQEIRGHQHSFRLLPRQTITMSFGPPVRLDRFHGRPWTDATLQEVTDEILRAILNLLDPLRPDQPPPQVTEGRPGWSPEEAERRAEQATTG